MQRLQTQWNKKNERKKDRKMSFSFNWSDAEFESIWISIGTYLVLTRKTRVNKKNAQFHVYIVYFCISVNIYFVEIFFELARSISSTERERINNSFLPECFPDVIAFFSVFPHYCNVQPKNQNALFVHPVQKLIWCNNLIYFIHSHLSVELNG